MAKEIKRVERTDLPAPQSKYFRQKIQMILMDNEEKLMDSLSKLPPKDFCDAYIRLLPFGFSRVPEEKALESEDRAKAILEERKRTVTIIQGNEKFDAKDLED